MVAGLIRTLYGPASGPGHSIPATMTTVDVALPTSVRAGYSSGSLVTGAFGTVPGLLLLPYLTDTLGVAAAVAGLLVLTPKALDPLAVITHEDDTVWDSSICETAIVAQPIQLVPGWAMTIQIPWNPIGSGDACSPDEPWLDPGDYTLRVGTLGGEPGRADFTLSEPPPPPTPEPTPAPTETVVPVEPTPAPE